MKKLLSLVICLALIISLLPTVSISAKAEFPDRGFSDTYYGEAMDTSGLGHGAASPGPEPTDSLTWKFESGTLTISGEGKMARYPWKDYKGQITKVVIEEGVTSICSDAFKDCTALCEIVIPDTVTSIGGYAFYNCNMLWDITIPQSVTAIHAFAFGGKTAISRVNIESIAAWCNIDFDGTPIANPLNKGGALYLDGKQITNLVIPDGVKKIGYYAFYNYKSLESVTIPASLEYVGERAFENCTSIKKVYIEDVAAWCDIYFGRFCGTSNPMMYGADLYLNDELLENLVIPDGVERIYGYAFIGAESLKSVTVPESVLGIDQYAFAECTQLNTIKLPDTLEYMGAYAFYNTKYYNVSANWKDGILYIGNYLINARKNVTKVVVKEGTEIIADGAFAGSTVNDLSLPEGLVTIGRWAFEDCISLASVTIPESVKYIEGSAFIYCSGLTEVTFLSKDVEIGSISVFMSCNDNLIIYCYRDSTAHKFAKTENLNFKIIGDKPINGDGWTISTEGHLMINYNGDMTDAPWLEYKDRIESVEIYSGLTSICEGAFKDCTNLSKVSISGTVKSIGKDAFKGTAFYNKASSWQNGALYLGKILLDVKSSTEITVKEGTTLIADGLFKNRTNLEKITLPATVKVTDGMFEGCIALKQVVLENGMTEIGKEAFKGCVSLEELNIPRTVTKIGEFAFMECPVSIVVEDWNENYSSLDGILYNKDKTNLIYAGCVESAEYAVANGVRNIEPYAFYKNAHIQTVVIPSSVITIGEGAFASCLYLSKITIPYVTSKIGENAFSNCDENLVIICYEDSSAHKYAEENNIDYTLDGTSVLAKGKCGDNLEWSLYEDGCFFISGNGTMLGGIPWSDYKDKIKKIAIGEGITTIDNNAFEACTSLTDVSIAQSVTDIYSSAFSGCTALQTIVIPEGVKAIDAMAFYGCTSLTNISIPKSVAKLGTSSFRNCTSLSDIKIPAKVLEIFPHAIENTAYYNNQNNWTDGVLYCGAHLIEVKNGVATFDVKQGTVNIANSASSGNSALKRVGIYESVQNIGASAFATCTSLTEVAINSKSLSIGTLAFAGCTSLANVICRSNEVSVGENAFRDCQKLVFECTPGSALHQFAKDNNHRYKCSGSTSITSYSRWSFDSIDQVLYLSAKNDGIIYPDTRWQYLKDDVKKIVAENGVKYIPASFAGFTALESIELAESVTRIKAGAFKDCTALKSVTLPNIGLIFLEESTFEGCTSLKEINLPITIGTVEKRLFAGCTALESVILPKYATCIEQSAFEGCTALENIAFPNELKVIGPYAFKGCLSLERAILPDSVTSIGDHAFENCLSLKSINLPQGMAYIYAGTFKGCASLKEIDIPSGVKSIEASAFAECTKLESVTIPDGVTSIGAFAFNNCTALKKVNIPSTVTNIGKDAFGNTALYDSEENWEDGILYFGTYLAAAKPDITVANIKAGTVFIAENAFKDCKALESVTIPSSVTSIGYSAFESCSALKEIVMPSSVKSIGDRAFKDCVNLEKASIQGSIGIIGEELFSGCTSLKSVNIPKGVTKIKERAFFGCAALEGVIFPNSLKVIEGQAFSGCASLVDVTIVNSIDEIGFNAFERCTGLTKVTILHKPFLQKNIFAGCENLTIYCYNGSSAKEYAAVYDIPVVIATPQNVPPVSGGGGGDSKPKPKVGLVNFKVVNEYKSNFTDVKDTAWYFGDVKVAYEFDLVKGVAEDEFNPTGNISIAEAITLAARIHSIYNTGKAEFVQGETWYQVYVDYAIEKGIIIDGQFTDYNAPATRADFAEIFAKAIPESDYNGINNIEKGKIPDVSSDIPCSDAVYMLYNAGVVQGSDEAHSFKPDTNIQRCEVAAIITRIIDKTKRITFTIE
ncbi:MAG: leucine-rich repeat protein [Clostridia bacterium]|nr:leucine-rich repeat protein [Clostridia bacterium]